LGVIADSGNPVVDIEHFDLVDVVVINDYWKWVFSALVIISLK